MMYLVISAPPSESGLSQWREQLAVVNSWNQGFLGWLGRSEDTRGLQAQPETVFSN